MIEEGDPRKIIILNDHIVFKYTGCSSKGFGIGMFTYVVLDVTSQKDSGMCQVFTSSTND